MSFIPVLEYLAGFFIFGLVKVILDVVEAASQNSFLNNIPIEILPYTTAGELAHYFWVATVIVYLIGGAFWLWRKYIEPINQTGVQ